MMQRSKKRAVRAMLEGTPFDADQILQGDEILPKQLPALRQALIDRDLWNDTVKVVNDLVVADLKARGTPWPSTGEGPPSDILRNEFEATARRLVLQVGLRALIKPSEIKALAAPDQVDPLEEFLTVLATVLVVGVFYLLWWIIMNFFYKMQFFSWINVSVILFLSVAGLMAWGAPKEEKLRQFPSWDVAE
jgi:hypothetical protein